MDSKELISVREASVMLGVSTSTIYGWAKNDKITITPPQPPKVERDVVERIAKEREEMRA